MIQAMARKGSFIFLVFLCVGFIICIMFWTSRYDESLIGENYPTAAERSSMPNVTSQRVFGSIEFPSTYQAWSSLTDDEYKDTYDERRELARNMCQKYKNLNQFTPSGHIWSYGYPEGIHYCLLPKIGCTYWKQIFRFLNKAIPQDKNISKPSDIPRHFVHAGSTRNIPITKIGDRVSTQLLSGRKFMFSRDPYSRLWSAYIDKFHLPDFWNNKNILKFARHNATQAETVCPKDITFHEFLLFVTGTEYMNPHWKPMYQICSPCHVNYDIIGHQETFAQDAKYILNSYGHGNLIEEIEQNKRVNTETSMLIEYNLNLDRKIRKKCSNKLDVAKRLWTAFQYNGYVHKDTEFPKNINMTLFNWNPINEFSKWLNIVLEDQRRHGIKLKTQKLEIMTNAYRDIPKDVLQNIKKIYKFDFELFGYELEPTEIFGERS